MQGKSKKRVNSLLSDGKLRVPLETTLVRMPRFIERSWPRGIGWKSLMEKSQEWN